MFLNTNASSVEKGNKTLLNIKVSLDKLNAHKESIYQNLHPSDATPCNWSCITCIIVKGSEHISVINLTGTLSKEILDGFHIAEHGLYFETLY